MLFSVFMLADFVNHPVRQIEDLWTSFFPPNIVLTQVQRAQRLKLSILAKSVRRIPIISWFLLKKEQA